MSKHAPLLVFVLFLKIVTCKEFNIGMFKKTDYLIAQDTVYKPAIPFQSVTAKYGRTFKCLITFLRVSDRLGLNQGIKVQIIRGGLLKTFVVMIITSAYNQPISVNVQVGCEKKLENKYFKDKKADPAASTPKAPGGAAEKDSASNPTTATADTTASAAATTETEVTTETTTEVTTEASTP